jgi:lysophospholipase L1-like esterase/ferritin-like protein
VSGATAYHIYWSKTAGVSKKTGTMIPNVSSPYTHTGLTNGATYYYVVTAIIQGEESADSSEVSATLNPPAAPQNLMSISGSGQAILSWGMVSGVPKYNIYWSTTKGVRKEAAGTMIPNVSSPYAHTGLTNDVTYYYVVTAVTLNGESDESSEVSATPSLATPPLPPSTVATHESNKAVNIAWSASQSGEAVTSYNIYWSVSSGVTKENGVKIKDIINSPYVHANLIHDTTYYYIVTGVNTYGEGSASQEVSATPNRGDVPLPPTGLTATAGKYEATISWNAVDGATTYNIYWSTSSDVSSQKGKKIEALKNTYLHTGLSEETTYYYVVTAVNGHGESEDSDKVSVRIVNPRQDIFVAMGDSITIGYGLNNYDNSYVARLSRTWGKTAVNEGVDGTKSSYGTAIIRPIIIEHNPRYLTIYYGSNDVGFFDNDGIVSNLQFIIDVAKSNGTIPVVATLGPFFGQWDWRQPSVIDLNKKIRKMAADEGIACADLEAALNWNSAYINTSINGVPDGMHPNSAGHQIIANTFYQALTR